MAKKSRKSHSQHWHPMGDNAQDPDKNSGEAKLALMKLNRTEPLNLNICIAHKEPSANDSSRMSEIIVNGKETNCNAVPKQERAELADHGVSVLIKTFSNMRRTRRREVLT
ncbi:unnamed protein product, partial [Iphiclides podalirius]